MSHKTSCNVPGCEAWAVHSANPPLCSPHTQRLAGIPPGSGSHAAHGSYAALLLRDRHTLTPRQLKLVEDAISLALDELGQEWGLPL